MKVVDISVELVDSMGSDLAVVRAARVSFAKTSQMEVRSFPNPYTLQQMFSGEEYPELVAKEKEEFEALLADGWIEKYSHMERLAPADKKLINYLAKHNHWSPFAHCFLSFRIKAPIFCARQLVKHQVGLAWNEVSRRYIATEPEFYMPKQWHLAPENKKQGSGDVYTDYMDSNSAFGLAGSNVYLETKYLLEASQWIYGEMLRRGIAPEEARMILPQNTMTEWIWSGSLFAFARVVNLRTDSHAQKAATQEVAGKIAQIVKEKFPVSFEALCTQQ